MAKIVVIVVVVVVVENKKTVNVDKSHQLVRTRSASIIQYRIDALIENTLSAAAVSDRACSSSRGWTRWWLFQVYLQSVENIMCNIVRLYVSSTCPFDPGRAMSVLTYSHRGSRRQIHRNWSWRSIDFYLFIDTRALALLCIFDSKFKYRVRVFARVIIHDSYTEHALGAFSADPTLNTSSTRELSTRVDTSLL